MCEDTTAGWEYKADNAWTHLSWLKSVKSYDMRVGTGGWHSASPDLPQPSHPIVRTITITPTSTKLLLGDTSKECVELFLYLYRFSGATERL